jgi:hypothetical protein
MHSYENRNQIRALPVYFTLRLSRPVAAGQAAGLILDAYLMDVYLMDA